MIKLATWLIAAVLVAAAPPAGQDASELLQKGIYTQETLGDLEAAIRIYQEVVSMAAQTRGYASQAQYRLGLCLLKKGDAAQAAKAFERLIAEYPQEKELVAQARAHLPAGPALLPAPWGEGEILEMKLRMAGGMPVGLQVYQVEPRGADGWLIQARSFTPGGNGLNTAEVERDTMRPISGSQKLPVLGEAQAVYQANQVVVTTKGNSRTVALPAGVLDNESALYYLRRLPLAPGYKAPLTVVGALGGVPLQMDFEVTGMEDVKVPVGAFHCYRVYLPRMAQTFWFAADASRRLVKFEANNVVAELQNVRAPGTHSPTNYHHSEIGYTLTLPPGWLTADMPAAENLLLADPEMAGLVYIWARSTPVERNAIERSLRGDVELKIKTRLQEFKNYKVRPETSQPRRIGQYNGFSYLADFTDRGQPMTEYLTWVQSESVFMLFIARAEPAKIDGLRDRLDRLIESVQLK